MEAWIKQLQQDAVKLDEQQLDEIAKDIGDASYVLLGEASHGTSEFYKVRAELSQRLIEQKGFSVIAVEGDWPSCYGLNRYIKGDADAGADARESLRRHFNRWPEWMWANEEVAELIEWMKTRNDTVRHTQQISFLGLDVYSLWESMEEVLRYLERTGSPDVNKAKEAMTCFEPYGREGQLYGASTSFLSDQSCEDEVVELLLKMREARRAAPGTAEHRLDAEMNALVAVHAEQYYRAMIKGGPESWNIRDRHMVEVLQSIQRHYGHGTKVIVWEHNTHIGDARATDMAEDGMVNVGQLLKEAHAREDVYAIGFGTYTGTVLAADAWGDPVKAMPVPNAVADSWESLLHANGAEDQWVRLRDQDDVYPDSIGHRAIGVVYHPGRERFGNYVPSVMPQRYDAFIHIDQTTALHPLVTEAVEV